MIRNFSRRTYRRLVTLIALPLAALLLGAQSSCPMSKQLTGQFVIEEAEGTDGTAAMTALSPRADPTKIVQIDVTVSSGLGLETSEASVEIVMTCQFGNTKKFPVTLTKDDEDGRLRGRFIRTANVGEGECIGYRGQREYVVWTIRLIRPANVLDGLVLDYHMTYFPY